MSEFEEKASYLDKTKFSDTWVLLIRRATLARIILDLPEYRRCIDTLLLVLIRKERDLAVNYLNELRKLNPNFDENKLYDLVLTRIIDLLNEGGYLTKKSFVEICGDGNEDSVKGDV